MNNVQHLAGTVKSQGGIDYTERSMPWCTSLKIPPGSPRRRKMHWICHVHPKANLRNLPRRQRHEVRERGCKSDPHTHGDPQLSSVEARTVERVRTQGSGYHQQQGTPVRIPAPGVPIKLQLCVTYLRVTWRFVFLPIEDCHRLRFHIKRAPYN